MASLSKMIGVYTIAEQSSVIEGALGAPPASPAVMELDSCRKIIRMVHQSEALWAENWTKRILGDSGLITEIFAGYRSFRNSETMAYDTTTTPFENLLRSTRMMECYASCLTEYQVRYEIRGSKGFPLLGSASGRGMRCNFWVLTDSEIARAIGFFWHAADLGVLEKSLKYLTAHLLAVALRQKELPAAPKWVSDLEEYKYIFPCPSYIEWWKSVLQRKRLRTFAATFAYNIYQCKNASLPPSRSFVDAALVKHKEILCGPHVDPMTDENPLSEKMESSIQRAVQEIFGCNSYTKKIVDDLGNESYIERHPRSEHLPHNKFPSLGASEFVGRHNGGAYGEISYEVNGKRIEYIKETKQTIYRLPGFPVFLGFARHPKKDYLVEPVYGSIDPEDMYELEEASRQFAFSGESAFGPSYPYVKERHESLSYLNKIIQGEILVGPLKDLDPLDYPQLTEIQLDLLKEHLVHSCKFDKDQERWENQRSARGRVRATVVPLLEAFKVRTITKGQVEQYHLARRWQSEIWGRMSRFYNAQLIGRPCSAEFLTEHVLQHPWNEGINRKEAFYVSGDYESATDLLNPWLSTLSQDYISKALGIPLEDQSVLLNCLTGHLLNYDGGNMTEREYERQTWGQLMGSPTSFPVLCLINLAATRLSYEIRDNKKYRLRDLPMVVNGDDILFVARDSQHYKLWKEITGFCGLKFSVGKNYTHKRFLVINSELYRVTRSYQAKRLPIVNYRLIYGGTRSTPDGLSLRPVDHKSATESIRVRFDENHFQAYHDYHMPITAAEEIREKQFSKDPKLANLEDLELQVAIRSKLAFFTYQLERPMRIEAYKKWFLTLPTRQQTFIQQVRGDYEINDEEMEPVMALFRSVQFRLWRTYKNEFPNERDKIISNYLPRALGGVGFRPPLYHIFTPLDRALAQTLKENPEGALEFQKWITPGIQSSDMMKNLNGEIGRIRNKLQLETTYIPIPEWDEFLERNGIEDLSSHYGTGILYAFADVDAHISHDIFEQAYEDARRDMNYRFTKIRSVMRAAKERLSRWKGEKGGIMKVLKGVTKISDESWFLRVHRTQPILP